MPAPPTAREHKDGMEMLFRMIHLSPLSFDPPDPEVGQSVVWMSDGTGTGNAGDLCMKVNVAGVVSTGFLAFNFGYAA